MRDDPEYHWHRKAEWYLRTRERHLKQMRDWRRKTHAAAIARLGTHCACCGEGHVTMLQIDHINGGGHRECKEFNGNNFRIYQKIVKMKNPHEEYQTLCPNCNYSKRRNKGLCEHKTEAPAIGWCA